MNANQEAELNMQRGVEQHFDDNQTIIAAVPAFLSAANDLKALNAQIVAGIGGQEAPRTGFAKDKLTAESALIAATLKIAKPVRAFATATGNNTLRDEVDIEFSDLNRLRDDQLAPRCQIIHDRAANLGQLGDYGITAAKLQDLQNKIDAFAAQVPKPRADRADRSVKTVNLEELFRESKKALKITDDLIDNFEDDHPDFVAKYKNLREIDKPPSRPRKPKNTETGNTGDSGAEPA
jgi:hypothetical protein